MAEPEKKKKKNFDLIQRGNHEKSPLGTALFVGLRALDGFVLQRALLIWNPLPALFTKFGLAAPLSPPTGAGTPLSSISAAGLTPFQTVIWSMSIGSALKQIFWLLGTSKEEFPPSAAIAVSVFNTIMNGLGTLAFTLSGSNPTWSATSFYISIPIFVSGILIETISEIQRKSFKDTAKNEGKLYSDGLFAYARHINYCGYMFWRSAMAMAAGGPVWGALVASFFWMDFNNRSIPVLDEYCSGKYGEQWEAVKRKVPYQFLPGVK